MENQEEQQQLNIELTEEIADGTYGFSDVSGSPIPRERLEAVPDAVCTFEEEGAYERRHDRS